MLSRSFSSVGLVDLFDLWVPSEGVSHGAWLVGLVTALIRCEAVTNEVLRLLGPVCSVKVNHIYTLLLSLRA